MAADRPEEPTVEGDLASELARAREAQAELLQRALRAERRANGFVHMVHEIRTLLGAVTGLTTMLLDGELAGEQRDHVKRLRASGAALLEIVNGVLDFSKLEAGTLRVDAVDFDLRRKLEEVVALAADRADAKGLEIVASVEPDVPIAVAGDGVRLRQALLNLVINAIKFTTDGCVVLRARLARPVAADTERALVAIDVIDTGAGIAPEALAHVFEPFHQADPSAERRSTGTGLGLSIVRGFVEAMGGGVTVESALGRGSRFTVTLPLGRRRTNDTPRSSRVDLAGRKLLVVESVFAARRDIELSMRELGLEVVGVPTVDDARKYLRAARPLVDVVVIGAAARDAAWSAGVRDLAMDLPDAKVIVASHASQPLPPAIGRFVAAHLAKPFRLSRLVAAVEGCFATMKDTIAVTATAPHGRPKPRAKLPSLLETGEFPRLSALVVEDDATNARVVKYFLEKRGWSVTTAGDGREAVERMRSRSYDLVLLDWHTPRLDGLSAAREIREREAPGQRTPLVALTAIASEGAREQCLDAGMDDYLSKPIVEKDLDAVLAKVVAGAYSKNPARRPSTPPRETVVDYDALRTLVGGEAGANMLREVARIFTELAPARMRALRTSIGAKDGSGAFLAAHSLRGMCSQMAANSVAKRFIDLEQSARAGGFDEMAASIDAVDAELRRLLDEVAAHFTGRDQSTRIRAAG